MPRTPTTFQDIMRQRRNARVIPLLDITPYRDRFDDNGRVSGTLRLSDRHRIFDGNEYIGAIKNWGHVLTGLARNTALDIDLNNRIALPIFSNGLWLPARRFTDHLRVGNNRINTFDPAFWDARLGLLFEGGGSSDLLVWTSLIFEEPNNISEDVLTARFSGLSQFLSAQDPSNLTTGSIISIATVGNDGKKIGQGNSLQTANMVSSGGFRYLLCWILRTSATITPTEPTSIRYGSTPMVFEGAVNGAAGEATSRMWLYSLIAPPEDTAPVFVDFDLEDDDGSPNGSDKVIGAVLLNNVHQTQPHRGVTTAGLFTATPTTFPSSERGDRVLDGAGYWFEAGILPNLEVGAGQTQLVNRSDEGDPGTTLHRARMGVSHQLGAFGSVTMDWLINPPSPGSARNWVAIGLSLVPAG